MEENQLQKSDFNEVAIGDFISGTELPVDVFIQLSGEKFVRIARAGERVSLERFSNYEAKQVTHLLIRKQEYNKYLQQGLTIAGIVIKNKELPMAQRQTSLTQIAANVFTEVESLGMTRDIYTYSKVIASAAVSLCQAKSDLMALMEHFAQHSGETLYAHSVAVSQVSVMIGIKLNWKSVTLEKLALGGLFHDIGKRELAPALLKKTRALMTPKDVIDYESHCFRGMQILRSISEIPDDVVACAYEHHENSLGLGYPRKIKQIYINPLARVVGLANEFCNLTLKNRDTAIPKTPTEALHVIQVVMGQPYWPDAFTALKQLIPKSPKSKDKTA